MSSSGRALIIEDRVVVPDTAFDHTGYRAWVTSDAYPERVRTTYVRGEVRVEMSPESIEAHNKVKAALTAALVSFVHQHDLGEVYLDGALVTNEDAGLSCEPDLTFVSWAAFDEGRVRLVPRAGDGADYIEILGSPDLVVEIVSDSSVKKDTRLLREAYCLAGVREYWLIDARGNDIRFEILSKVGDLFASSGDPFAPQESGVLGGRWSLTRTRNRAGRFTYNLEQTL
ncbi:MAG: Uma2 family endonuclease [Acidobacteriota bacterium]|nr:Uma2 family endonuclease [Acidobacteriota bacterium]